MKCHGEPLRHRKFALPLHWFGSLGAITADGRLFCSAGPFDGEFDAREQSWFRQAVTSREFSIGDYQVEAPNADPKVVLAYPVVGGDGQLVGVTFACLDAQWLNHFNLSMEKNLPRGSIVAQVDDRGTILSQHPHPEAWSGWPARREALIDAFRSRSKGMATLPGPGGQPWLYVFSETHNMFRNQKVHLLMGVPQGAVFEEADRLLVHNLILLAGGPP